MQENCNYGNTITNILTKQSAVPNALKKDVVKLNYTVLDEMTSKGTLQLKNATAFGYPISKITLDDEYDGRYLTVYFKDKNFMKLLPDFYVKLGNTKIPAGKKVAYVKATHLDTQKTKITKIDYKNIDKIQPMDDNDNWSVRYVSTPNGWYVNDLEMPIDGELSFNSKTKTITCNTLNPYL